MIPKFRAWHKTWEEMGWIARIRYKKSGEIARLSFRRNIYDGNIYGGLVNLDEIELMQSTGIFDKNNTEIFEGDIVRVLDSTYTVFYDNERGSYRLKPHDDRWNVDYMSNFSHGGNFEVIGNIYENKELLDA